MRAVANSVRGLKSRLDEFTVMQEYVDDFSNKIGSVDKVTQRIIKEQRGTSKTLSKMKCNLPVKMSIFCGKAKQLKVETKSN